MQHIPSMVEICQYLEYLTTESHFMHVEPWYDRSKCSSAYLFFVCTVYLFEKTHIVSHVLCTAYSYIYVEFYDTPFYRLYYNRVRVRLGSKMTAC
jgi:hypothetical protein